MEEKRAQYLSQRKELTGQVSGLEKADMAAAAAADKKRAEDYAKAQEAAAEKAKKAKEAAEKKAAETAKKAQAEVLKSYENGIIELQLKIRESNIGTVDKKKALEDQDRLNQAILEKERYRLSQGLITQQEFDNIRLEQRIAFQEQVAELEKLKLTRRKQLPPLI